MPTMPTRSGSGRLPQVGDGERFRKKTIPVSIPSETYEELRGLDINAIVTELLEDNIGRITDGDVGKRDEWIGSKTIFIGSNKLLTLRKQFATDFRKDMKDATEEYRVGVARAIDIESKEYVRKVRASLNETLAEFRIEIKTIIEETINEIMVE